MKLGIIGSQTFYNYQIFLREFKKNVSCIIHGKNKGIDKLANQLAENYKITTITYDSPCNYENIQSIINDSDVILSYLDNSSIDKSKVYNTTTQNKKIINIDIPLVIPKDIIYNV